MSQVITKICRKEEKNGQLSMADFYPIGTYAQYIKVKTGEETYKDLQTVLNEGGGSGGSIVWTDNFTDTSSG